MLGINRFYRFIPSESVLLALFMLAIFYGNIYGKITLPLSIILIPLLAFRLRVRSLVWQSIIPALACIPVVMQFFGETPPVKADISVYFCFFYSAVVVLILSRCRASEAVMVNSILFGSVLMAVMMLVNAGMGYKPNLEFYRLKNLVATPLGSSNYLAVFLLFGFIVALYARQYLCAVALGGAFMLTFSRTGYGMIALALMIWIVDTKTPLIARWPRLALGLLVAFLATAFFAAFFKQNGLPESLAIRVSLWHAAVYHFADYPILGTPRSEYFYIFNGKAWDPHNSVLNLLLLVGVLGSAIYLFYLYKAMSLFAKLAHVSIFWRSIFIAFVMTLSWSLFEVILLTPAYDILLASMFGLGIATKAGMTFFEIKTEPELINVTHQQALGSRM